MNEELYPYYQRELRFIRQLAKEFAGQYPQAAGRLLLEADRSTDPHIERLIESFAFLTGRVHHKIDDEFPELTDALLGVLYPHYLAPVPSMAVLQFDLDTGTAQPPDGFVIEAGSALHTEGVEYEPGKRLPCQYRTGYPVTLWPVAVTHAALQPPPFPSYLSPPPGTRGVLRLHVECQGEARFQALSLDRLRVYLSGDNMLTASLYELLCNHVLQVVIRPTERASKVRPVVLGPDCVSQVGFGLDEGLLPYPPQAFAGYRLLTEFFAFPAKFLFLDLGGWRRAAAAGFEKGAEVVFFLNRTEKDLEQNVNRDTFRLGCAPVVNLFERTAEPVTLFQNRYEYLITPDVAHPLGLEVYGVRSVRSVNPTTGVETEYQPFYSFRHGGGRDALKAFWFASRQPSPVKGDRGTELYLNLVDLGFEPRRPAEQVLIVQTTCTNRDLPTRLQAAGEDLAFELEEVAPLRAIRCVRTPTPTLRPPLRRGAHWRLLSHLNLNYLSLANPAEGRESLQEILRLYDYSDPEINPQQAAVTRNLIDGILSVGSRRVVGRTGGPASSGFARGIEVTVEFDEQKYVGTGAFLFACVLERFLGLYASINSFSQLVGRTRQGEGYFKKWPPRAGEQPLL